MREQIALFVELKNKTRNLVLKHSCLIIFNLVLTIWNFYWITHLEGQFLKWFLFVIAITPLLLTLHNSGDIVFECSKIYIKCSQVLDIFSRSKNE